MTRRARAPFAAVRAVSGGATGLAATASLALACASEVPDYVPDADTGSRHAVVSVERSSGAADEEGAASAEAFAQFAQVPASDDPSRVLRATGVLKDVPAMGECVSVNELSDYAGPLVSLGHIELLDVGQVAVQVDGSVTQLGAHAFPTVSDFASGVVYATRDRDAELPAGESYLISIDGTAEVPGSTVEVDAPSTLDSVTLGGVPLSEVAATPVDRPMDLTWSVGASGDIVFAEVSAQDESAGVICSFNDEDGVGTVPAELLPAGDTVRLSIHRLRLRPIPETGFDTGVVRFDFEVTTYLELE